CFLYETASTEFYTLSLHDALPIYLRPVADDVGGGAGVGAAPGIGATRHRGEQRRRRRQSVWHRVEVFPLVAQHAADRTHHRLHKDRKSTRLNSSHVKISYAVFRLK